MKENRWKGILPTLGVFAAEFLIAAAYLYPRGLRGELLSVRQVSSNPTETLMQSAISILVPAVLLVLLVFLLKKDFASQLCLKLKGRWQIILTGILCTAILGITVYCLIVKADKGSILFALLYYLVFIAFAEEFVYRDVCTWFLRERSWPVRYLIPNICFAVLHVFSYAHWGEISGTYLIRFVFSDLPGLALGGCLFQLLKEKSGTIWLPVLLHGLMDYSVVLNY